MMLKKTLFALLLPLSVFGQFQDDFSGSNLAAQWLGNTSDFTLNNGELQLNAAAAGTSQLYAVAPTADSSVWELYLRLVFAPSTSNQLKVYLATDNSDFSAALNGYFLLIGETGSNDALELRRQDGTTSTVLIRGTDAAVANEPVAMRVRVVRDAQYNWSLFADYTGGTNYTLEGTNNDNTHSNGNFFGIQCRYTITRIDKFFFDDVLIQPLFEDEEPPQLLGVTVAAENELALTFNENIDLVTASDVTNYSVNNGIGTPSQAFLEAGNGRVVRLVFNNNFQDGVSNQLIINNLEDEAGNAISPQTVNFQYVELQTAAIFDLLINEIFADPEPSIGLPNQEFVEIFNRSDKNFSLKNYTLSDASRTAVFPDMTLQAGEYAILCRLEDTALFSGFGKTIGLEDFPSLTNTGKLLQLHNAEGELLDAVEYSDTWYGSSAKADGGWTLERIYGAQPCRNGVENWTASLALIGGTPCSRNSVANDEKDENPPKIVRAFPVTKQVVRLFFSEKITQSTAENLSNYTFSDNLTLSQATLETPHQNTVLLTFADSLLENKIYSITINENLTDCIGNATGSLSRAEVALPAELLPKDVVINEVLFNPQTGGSDFVEIYNRSDKILNLQDLRIGSANEGLVDNLAAVAAERLFFPKTYLVFTENSVDISSRYTVENPDNLITQDLPTYPDNAGGVVLVANNRIIDQFNYSEDYHFGLLRDDNGVSLERLDTESDTQNPDNWHSAAETVGFATPTYRNSQQKTAATPVAADLFYLDKNSFSPDSDGFDDVLMLRYVLPQNGYLLNARIFDSNGRLVRNLTDNLLLASEGFLTWDGLTDEASKARIGIYILYLQIFSPNGDVSEVRKPCVLAGQF